MTSRPSPPSPSSSPSNPSSGSATASQAPPKAAPAPPSHTFFPRRRPTPRNAALGRKLGLALFTGLSGVLAFSLLTDGGRNTRAVASFLPAAEQLLYWTGLRIEQVALSGQRFTADADVFEAIDLANASSLATFDAAGARARIEKLPWVATATISRVYPATLEVHLTERQPAAVWLNDGREYAIDSAGRVLSALKKGSGARLPRISGAGAPQEAQALLDLIVRFPRIAERYEVAERVGGRRWTLHLKDGIIVHLGADREAVALGQLSSTEELGKLLTSHDMIIDLRGRVSVRRADPSAPATRTPPPTQS